MQILKEKRTYLIGTLIIAGLAISIFGVITIIDARKCASWPVVQGTIIDSFVDDISQSSNKKKAGICTPDIKYEYIYKDQTYFNNTISYFPTKTIGVRDFYYAAPEAAVCKFVEKYPIASKVDIHVCPYDPNFSILDPSLRTPVFLPIILGILLIYSACHMVIFGSHYFYEPHKK
jgi:hypothetical protein